MLSKIEKKLDNSAIISKKEANDEFNDFLSP